MLSNRFFKVHRFEFNLEFTLSKNLERLSMRYILVHLKKVSANEPARKWNL